MTLSVLLLAIYLIVSVAFFGYRAEVWWRYGGQDTARDALAAWVWPVTLVRGIVKLVWEAIKNE